MSTPSSPISAVETWRTVPGFEGYYEASDHGRIRSVDRNIVFEHPTHGTIRQKLRGKVLRPGRMTAGYLFVVLSWRGKVTNHAVSRLVLAAFVGPCPDGHQAKSLNDDRADCRLANLAWQSIPEIRIQAIASGATPVGERHYRAKLTSTDIAEIRAATGITQGELATRFSVSRSRIYAIRRGVTWKSVSVSPEVAA